METPVSALFLLYSWQREAGGTASLRVLWLCLRQLALFNVVRVDTTHCPLRVGDAFSFA